MEHLYVNSNPQGFDSNCLTCGGKNRDAIHHMEVMKLTQTAWNHIHPDFKGETDGQKFRIQKGQND